MTTKREKTVEIRRVERDLRRRRQTKKLREIRCFWTWPFGHYYEYDKCVHCRKPEIHGA